MNITITTFKENEDGSADCSFETDKEGKEALLRYGIMAMLKEIINEGNNLLPTGDTDDGQ
jgi:hypothetical protein